MAGEVNSKDTIELEVKGAEAAAKKLESLQGTVQSLRSHIMELLGATEALSQSVSKFPASAVKAMGAARRANRSAMDEYAIKRVNQEGALLRAGIKTSSNHNDLQAHIKAMTELASTNAELVKAMKHLSPEEIGLKKSGHKIALGNQNLGWAKLENQQDRFFKYSNNFMGGMASNLQMINSRIMNSGGLMGFMGQLGYRMSHNKNNFWSSAEYKGIDKKTGKPIYGDLPKNNINRILGLDKVTGGKGVNFGPLAMIAPVAAVAGVVSLGKAIKNLGEEAKAATGEIQMIKTQMSVVMGSDSLAAKTYEGIEKYALKSPFGVAQSADMATLLKQSGVNAAELLQTLKMIGDTSSGNAEKMKRVANNYAQIQAIGKASMLDMRQFAYAGIPIYKEVADYMKVSQVELRKMISEGKVTANVIEAVFKRMTGTGGTFENATMRGAQTLQARMQNLQDAQMIAQSHFGEWYMNLGGTDYNQGFGNFILQFKEGLADSLGNTFKQWNINDNFKKANSFLNSINSTTGKIDSKMPGGNGIPGYSAISGELKDAWINANGGIEKVQKDLSAYVKSYGGGKLGLTRVSDAYAKERERFFESKTTQKLSLVDARGETARKSQAELDVHIKFLKELEKTIISESEFKKNYDFWEKYDPRAFFAYSKEEVETARVAEEGKQESINKKEIANARYFDGSKILKSFDSLAGQFNTLYKQTPYGKWDELQKKDDERAAYNKTYAEFSKYQDNNNKLLIKNMKTLDELNKVLSSGMFKISDTVDVSNMTESQRKDFIKNIDSVIDLTIGQMKAHPEQFIGAGANYEKARNFLNQDFYKSAPIQDLLNIKNAAKNAKSLEEAQINTTNAINHFIQFNKYFGENFKGLQLRAMMSSFQSEDKAKSDLPPALMYRLAGGSLGMNAWRLPLYLKTPTDILKYWNDNFAQRDMVRGMIPNLMASNSNRIYNSKTQRWNQQGFSLKDIASAFVSNGNTVDWKATKKNMEQMAFSTKASISNLEAYGKIIDSQTSKLTEYYTTMITGGETLDEMIKGGHFSEELKTAFNTGALKDKQGHKLDYINGKLSYLDENKNRIELTEQEINALGENAQFMAKLTDSTQNLIETNNSLKDSIDGQIEINKYNENYNQTPEMAAALSTAMQITSPLTDKTQFSVRKIKDSMWNKTDWDSISGQDIYTNRKQFLESTISELNRKILSNSLSKDDERIIKLLEKSGLERKDKENQLFDDKGNLETWIDKNVFDISDIDSSDNFGSNSKLGKLSEDVLGIKNSAQEGVVAFIKLGDAIKNAFSQAPLDAFNNSMSKLGENIVKGVNGYEDMDKVIKNVGKSMMSNLAAAATQAGLSLISSGKISAGLALIAAGGMASFLGGLMSDTKDESDDGKLQKLKDLKQDLADLLRQAREDAIYYENHLRHTNALGYNSQVGTTTKVNDAIITPQGNVITTHPEDYLIASKNPSGLVGKAAGSPIVNIAIENNSGKQIQMKQESRSNGSGGVDIVAVIEETVGNYVSSSRSDEAFAAREARIKGRTVVA